MTSDVLKSIEEKKSVRSIASKSTHFVMVPWFFNFLDALVLLLSY